MEIPARPNKSSNPWYDAREAYDEAIENVLETTHKVRGNIPDGSDLNDFFGPDYRGIWRFTSSTQMENAPFNTTTAGIFEVISEGTGSNSTKQVFTNHVESYWREANLATSGNWGDWHKIVDEDAVDEKVSTAVEDIRYKGLLRSSDNLDDLIGVEWHGEWQFLHGDPPQGLPFTPTRRTNVTIKYGNIDTAVVQTIHTDSEIWWRRTRSEGGIVSWGDWYKIADEDAVDEKVSTAIEDFRYKGLLRSSDNLDDLIGAEWHGEWQFLHGDPPEGVPFTPTRRTNVTIKYGSIDTAAVQTIHTDSQIWWRRTRSEGGIVSWGEWNLVSHVDSDIVKLAKRDGWLAVYDPTDERRVELDSENRIVSIEDGLGNLPPMTVPPLHGKGPKHLSKAFGKFDGIECGEVVLSDSENPTFLYVTFDSSLPQPNTIMIFGENKDPSVATRYLFDTQTGLSTNRHALSMRPISSNRYAISAGDRWYGSGYGDSIPHLFTATFNGEESELRIDGNLSHYGADSETVQSLNGLRLGERGGPLGEYWRGTIGPVLVHNGEISEEAIQRMEKLLLSSSGIIAKPAITDSETIAYSESILGNPTFSHGDPNHLLESGIASMTKLMTVWLARQVLSNDDLNSTVEVLESDIHSGNRIQTGDVISVRDLIYAAMVPSDNTAPGVLGRFVGEKILEDEGGSGSGRTRFISEMNAEAERLGYDGASFVGTVGTAVMSARQVMDLFRRMLEDSELRSALSTQSYTLNIVGGPNTRLVDVTHTVFASDNPPFPNFLAAKTGTFGGRGHIVALWETERGEEHITVIMNTSTSVTNDRYHALRKVMVATS